MAYADPLIEPAQQVEHFGGDAFVEGAVVDLAERLADIAAAGPPWALASAAPGQLLIFGIRQSLTLRGNAARIQSEPVREA